MINVIDFDTSSQFGFAWILVAHPISGKELTVQCCMSEDAIVCKRECGHDWGLCADANEEAFEIFGEADCMGALFAEIENSSEVAFDI